LLLLMFFLSRARAFILSLLFLSLSLHLSLSPLPRSLARAKGTVVIPRETSKLFRSAPPHRHRASSVLQTELLGFKSKKKRTMTMRNYKERVFFCGLRTALLRGRKEGGKRRKVEEEEEEEEKYRRCERKNEMEK